MGWQAVDYKSEKLQQGVTYRATLWLPLSDDINTRNNVVSVLKNADSIIHKLPQPLQFGYQKFKLGKVETGLSVQDATNVRLRPWPLRVEFTYTNVPSLSQGSDELIYGNGSPDNILGIDDAVEAFAVIAGLIAVATIGITIISRSLEKLIAPVFNPGIAVLVVVALVVIFKGRRFAHG